MANGSAPAASAPSNALFSAAGETPVPPADGQDSETMRKLREKVNEQNAQSEANRLSKGGGGATGRSR